METPEPYTTPPELKELEALLLRKRAGLVPPDFASVTHGFAPPLRSGASTRSRAAVTSLLAAGVLMSGTGATLAVTGPSGHNDASSAVYGKPPPEITVLGEPPVSNPPGTTPDGTTLPPTQPTSSLSPAVQSARQKSTTKSDTLPFTGFAALAVLAAGLAMLSAGLLLRRRSGRHTA